MLMESKFTENSDSHLPTSSRLTDSINKKEEEFEQTLKSLSTVFDVPKKSHEELRNERITELNMEFQRCLSDENYEKAITIMKKLIFFEPTSK